MKEYKKTPIDNASLVIDYIKRNGSISRLETEKLTGLKTTAAHNLLKGMCADNQIKIVGTGKMTRYVL